MFRAKADRRLPGNAPEQPPSRPGHAPRLKPPKAPPRAAPQTQSKLLYWSETIGCGATIKLRTGEICMVSIAQSGVLVKASRGRFARYMVGLFGAILFNERNVYKGAQVGIALMRLFPKQEIPITFRNPVLNAFANAIWQCSSAANVAMILSNAVPLADAQAKRDEKIVDDLTELMARGETKFGTFYDVSTLPHPKELILGAIEREILREPLDARVELLKVGALFLTSFQEGIGLRPLHLLGVDIAELARTVPDLREQARIVANNKDSERATRYEALWSIELERTNTRLDAAVRSRNALIKRAANSSV
jgi:hypothetical protein